MATPEPARRRRPRPDDDGRPRAGPARGTGAPRRREASGPAAALRAAAEQLSELLGRRPESVSSVKPTDDGWEAVVEVVELERVPDTTSVMGSYRVTLDDQGELISYERTRRYSRGMIDRPGA
ncbi:gas vesicle protein GvpO [Streptomyces antimicrobicus]|uniref:Gas vesicle protein n=1 Tax=Streptomyces antimicrobicus TaxID=2883108 RepID=A0ABS8B3N6_9ACTN|nr:gas vesicle protein [Streptomyces antimicrobicus]MCB5179206.1 gas vesicle protein [Streptomyces antimicrobicus]